MPGFNISNNLQQLTSEMQTFLSRAVEMNIEYERHHLECFKTARNAFIQLARERANSINNLINLIELNNEE